MVKRLKDKNAPKRPLTGFLLYGNYLRSHDDQIKSLPVTQQASSIAELWRNLDTETKEKYNKESEKLKEQYKKDMEAYEQSDAFKEFQTALAESKLANDKKGVKKKRTGTTKFSGYRLFIRENKENIDEGLNEEEMGMKSVAKFGKKWKMLSEEERQVYNERAASMNPEPAGEEEEDEE